VSARAKIWRRTKKCCHAGARAKFSIARCRLSDTCVILVCGVHTHNNVCGVHTHNIGTRGLRRFDIAQGNFVGVRTMWVYVVVRQFI
jgi:hypothetical protein